MPQGSQYRMISGVRERPGRGVRGGALEEVLVLDFGGQYSQLIARRIRECGVFAELLPSTTSVEKIRERAPRALILSGGPASVYEDGAPPFPTQLLDLEIPLLGICYGMQAMVLALGGKVEAAETGEFGRTDLVLREGGGRLLGGLPEEQSCWMSHRDAVFEAPEGFTALASSPSSPVAACEMPDRGLYGIQFHPEVVHTPYGTEILTRFLRDIAGCQQQWSPQSVIAEQVEKIQAQVGDGRVICGLSGGVDSSVAAMLVYRAVGEKLTCVFVDHGLMRLNEAEQVVEAFSQFGIPLITSTPKSASSPSWPARTTRRPSARSSVPSSSASSRRRRRSSMTSASWSRARSTRT